jgi:hypothetical protein
MDLKKVFAKRVDWFENPTIARRSIRNLLPPLHECEGDQYRRAGFMDTLIDSAGTIRTSNDPNVFYGHGIDEKSVLSLPLVEGRRG